MVTQKQSPSLSCKPCGFHPIHRHSSTSMETHLKPLHPTGKSDGDLKSLHFLSPFYSLKRNKTTHPRFHTLLGEITIVSHAVTAPENPGARLHRAAATALSLQMPCFSTSGAIRLRSENWVTLLFCCC